MTTIEDARRATTWDEEEQKRPTKKRRFFVEDSPDKPVVKDGPTHVDVEAAPGDREANARLSALRENGFDIDMIETVVGEKLDEDTLYSLYSLANKSVETGRLAPTHASSYILTISKLSIYIWTERGRMRNLEI